MVFRFFLLYLCVFGVSCQSPQRDRAVGTEINQYRYVVSVWKIGIASYTEFKENPNIFRNDYYSTINKNTSQPKLIYYFEARDYSYALKLVIPLTENPLIEAELWKLSPDRKSCDEKAFAMPDFRRQSCYLSTQNLWATEPKKSIDPLHGLVLREIEQLQMDLKSP